MTYALCLIIAWPLLALVFLEKDRAKYKAAFRDVATQLYNVTADRNKLAITNEGLRREVARERVKNEQLMSGTGSGECTDFHCPGCKINLHYSMLEYAASRSPLFKKVPTLKPELRE